VTRALPRRRAAARCSRASAQACAEGQQATGYAGDRGIGGGDLQAALEAHVELQRELPGLAVGLVHGACTG